MKVYRTSTNPRRYRFHRSPDCWQLTKRPARGARADVQEVDLESLDRAIPCRTCFPDAPVAVSAHRYCPRCNKGATRPCPHNGGVLVHQRMVRRVMTMVSEPGDEYYVRRYVWPEMAHLYITD